MTLISSINVGQRIREDMGDIQSLAESIQRRGLLHPIITDENNHLIAGHRRLEACKLLGWTEIETKMLNDLSEREKRLIELEENTRRKDLTAFEQSKNLAELAETAKAILRDGKLLTPSVKNPCEGGRPEKPDSESKVSELLGIPRMTLNEAKHHVQAVEKHPELESFPKKEAIKTAKYIDQVALEEENPEERRKKIQQHKHEEMLRKMLVSFLDQLPISPLESYTDELLEYWMEQTYGDKQSAIESALNRIIHARHVIDKVEKMLQKLKKPRRVV